MGAAVAHEDVLTIRLGKIQQVQELRGQFNISLMQVVNVGHIVSIVSARPPNLLVQELANLVTPIMIRVAAAVV